MLIHANLPHRLWPEVISAACYITNRLPTKALDGKTLFEAWHGHKPNLSNLQVYSCDTYVVNYHAKSKGKMAPRSWAGTLVGYEAKNQWRIFDGKKVFVRRDVIFNESNLTYRSKPDPPHAEAVGDSDTVDLTEILVFAANFQPNADSLPDKPVDLVNHLLAEANSAAVAQSDANDIDFDANAANPLILDHP